MSNYEVVDGDNLPGIADLHLLIMCHILIPDGTGLPELLITLFLLMRLKCSDKCVMALLRILVDTSVHLCVLENNNFTNYVGLQVVSATHPCLLHLHHLLIAGETCFWVICPI